MSSAAIDRILGYTRRIAVVGLSDSPTRTSYQVAADLQARGYEIVPVNPKIDGALGQPAHASLAEVEGPIDLVDVFRREEYLADVAREVVERGGIRGLWNQLGLRSAEARRLADEAGLDYVEDHCLKVEVARRASTHQLPPAA